MKTGRVVLGAIALSSAGMSTAMARHHGHHGHRDHKPGGHKGGHKGHHSKGHGGGHKVPEIDAMSGMAVIALILCSALLFREKFSR